MSLITRLFVFAAIAVLSTEAAVFAAKDTEKIPPAYDALAELTPLLLPEDALERGISLSANTKMYRVEQAHYNLSSGCALIHTNEPIYISSCRANIFARSGATIVVSAKKEVTRVMNLSDQKHDSVRVIFGDHHISLNPGEELAVVSSRAADNEKAANEFVIRYRNAQTLSVSPEYNAVLFDFSLADALRHCLIFKQLTESPRAEDHLLLKEIIKTAAAVNTIFEKSRDAYTHGEDAVAQKQNGHRFALKEGKKKQRIALNASSSLND